MATKHSRKIDFLPPLEAETLNRSWNVIERKIDDFPCLMLNDRDMAYTGHAFEKVAHDEKALRVTGVTIDYEAVEMNERESLGIVHDKVIEAMDRPIKASPPISAFFHSGSSPINLLTNFRKALL